MKAMLHVFWTQVRRRILRVAMAFIGAMLAVSAAYSQFLQPPVPILPPVFSGSVAWGDYDNDGRLDFLLSGADGATGRPRLSLWHNTGNGFTDVTASVAPGLPGVLDCSVAWGDFDNDGRLDFLITGLNDVTSPFGISQIWHNTGTVFTNLPVPDLPGVSESSVAWSDFDSDGRLDFLLCGTTNANLSGAISQLWRNTGNGFTNVPIPGIAGTSFGSAAWGDFDNDGRPDFLITGNVAASQLWRNTGSGFENVPIAGLVPMFASSVAWGDYDNDGRLDFLLEGFTTNQFIAQVWRNTRPWFHQCARAGPAGRGGRFAGLGRFRQRWPAGFPDHRIDQRRLENLPTLAQYRERIHQRACAGPGRELRQFHRLGRL